MNSRPLQIAPSAKDGMPTAAGRTGLQRLLMTMICLLLIPASLTGMLHAAPLERLFYTPSERQQLDRLRAEDARAAVAGRLQESAQAEPAPEEPRDLYFGGMVSKKSRVQSLWLNGSRFSPSQFPPSVQPQPPYKTGRIRLQVPESGRTYLLRAGQTLDQTTGKISEVYERPQQPATRIGEEPESPLPPGPAPAKEPPP